MDHWRSVLAAVARFASSEQIEGLIAWAERAGHLERPRKADQDKLDAVLCALVGFIWVSKPRSHTIMIGDLTHGYMIAPASADVRARLTAAAAARGVPVDAMRQDYRSVHTAL